MALSTSRNSTNVRYQSPLDPWPVEARATARAPALVLAAWATFVVAGSVEGVFARLEVEAFVALAVFVVAFALAASRIDADAAALLAHVKRPLTLALALDALFLVAWPGGAQAPWTWTAFPGALLTFLVLPGALVLHAEALGRPRLRKAPGGSPAARRAAT